MPVLSLLLFGKTVSCMLTNTASYYYFVCHAVHMPRIDLGAESILPEKSSLAFATS